MTVNNELKLLLISIISHPELHIQWLNTLSFWEHCGARKLAVCEHPTKVKEEMLKHAAEEFRHAHYLKQQMHRLPAPFLPHYISDSLLGGIVAYRYLDRLEIAICRLLHLRWKLKRAEYRSLAYLLITYAIERRAEQVYGVYQDILQETKSAVRVQSILLEEKEHLTETTKELFQWPHAQMACHAACQLESNIYFTWLMTAKLQLKKLSKLGILPEP